MYEKYIAKNKDLSAVENALSFVYKKELEFIFKDKARIDKVIILSFDSENLYLWQKSTDKYKLKTFPHQVKIIDDDHKGWITKARRDEFSKNLPEEYRLCPTISGGLLTPFNAIHKKRNTPYSTYDSYLATIVHEFGHMYYNSHKRWYFSQKSETTNYLSIAKSLYKKSLSEDTFPQNKAIDTKQHFRIPIVKYHRHISEIFSFCTEYSASYIFWPEHIKKVGKYNINLINDLLLIERKKDLNKEDSVLVKDPHTMSLIFGIYIVNKYPITWPRTLLDGWIF